MWKKKTFWFYRWKHILRDNHAEYWKFETSGGLFQITATNVRNRQFVEDILANTRGRSMCRGDNDPPKEGEFVMKWFHLASQYIVEDWRNHLGWGCLSGKWGIPEKLCLIAKHLDEIHDDNKDIIEDDVRKTNVRTFVKVTDISKIVRKKSVFGFYRWQA